MDTPVELQANERVVLLARRHWVRLYPRLFTLTLLLVVPLAGLWLLVTRAVDDLHGLGLGALLVVSLLWAGYWGVLIYLTWFRYQHDVWLITNQRLVDAYRRHWFHSQIASADLVDIEDVSAHREGLLETVLDFGDVRVQTAGEQLNFVLADIPHTAHAMQVLDATRDEARRTLAHGM